MTVLGQILDTPVVELKGQIVHPERLRHHTLVVGIAMGTITMQGNVPVLLNGVHPLGEGGPHGNTAQLMLPV